MCTVCEGDGVINWEGQIVNCPKCDGLSEVEAQVEAYLDAEAEYYYGYFQDEMLKVYNEAHGVVS